MENKKLFLTGILVIVFIAILAVAGYVAYKSFNVPRGQTQKNSPAQTADWKTYTNNMFGFSFSYPPSLDLEKGQYPTTQNVGPCDLVNPNNKVSLGSDKNNQYIEIYSDNSNTGVCNLAMARDEFKNPTTNTNSPSVNSYVVFRKAEKISVNNVVFDTEENSDTTPGTPPISNFDAFTSNNGNIFLLSCHNCNKDIFGSEGVQRKVTFDQVVSTFKFINPSAQTLSWQTYTSIQYGFSIQYPDNYFGDIDTNSKTIEYLVFGKGNTFLQSFQTDTGSTIGATYYPMSVPQFIQKGKSAEGNTANVSIRNLKLITLNGAEAYTFGSGFTGMGTVCIDNEALIPVGSGVVNIILGKCAQDPCAIKQCTGGDNFNLEFSAIEKNIFNQMLSSFKFTSSANISGQDAVNLVKNLPEVKSWLALFNQPGGKSSIGGTAVVEVDHQDSNMYVVHAYEIVRNEHTATQGWYDVDKKTRSIKSEF